MKMSSNACYDNDTPLENWRTVMLDRIIQHKESFFENLRSKLINDIEEYLKDLSSDTNFEIVKRDIENKINGFDYEVESKFLIDGIFNATFEYFCQVIIQNSTECINKARKVFDDPSTLIPTSTKSLNSSTTTLNGKDGNNFELQEPSITTHTHTSITDVGRRSNLNQLISQSVLSNMSAHGGINLAGVSATIARDELLNNGLKPLVSCRHFNFEKKIQNIPNLVSQMDNNTQRSISTPTQEYTNLSLHSNDTTLKKNSDNNYSNLNKEIIPSVSKNVTNLVILQSTLNILNDTIESKDTEIFNVAPKDVQHHNIYYNLDLSDGCLTKKDSSNDSSLQNNSDSLLDFEISAPEISLSIDRIDSNVNYANNKSILNEKLIEKNLINFSSEKVQKININSDVKIEVHNQLNSNTTLKKPKKIVKSSRDSSKKSSKAKYQKIKKSKSKNNEGHKKKIKKKHKDKKSYFIDNSNKGMVDICGVITESNTGISDSKLLDEKLLPERKENIEVTNKTKKMINSNSKNINSAENIDVSISENITKNDNDSNEKITPIFINNILEESNSLDLNITSFTEKTNYSHKNNPVMSIDTKKQYEKAKKKLFLPDIVFTAKPPGEQKKCTNETNLNILDDSFEKLHVDKLLINKKHKSSSCINQNHIRKRKTNSNVFKVRITSKTNPLKCNIDTVSQSTDSASLFKNQSIKPNIIVKKETTTDQIILPFKYDDELNVLPDWIKKLCIVHQIKPCYVLLSPL
ncbi:putative uncharacterized protein DDB_G0282499 [Daktulosphaira vitifoliae]|uniref:putative uncharacterized protein DDB_G0282499 n=1 Tax=Daktulosphaira vitifoliae TaxID=58002 RepID=UPI0021A9A020|nr:putative uncharacterized protein DDB_G0282499 [Daktulosphaira vitifoliae]XP_050527218.1 putative uncharacterized protein DDB_G0282499 [Daktulosphaira vitifoliae]